MNFLARRGARLGRMEGAAVLKYTKVDYAQVNSSLTKGRRIGEGWLHLQTQAVYIHEHEVRECTTYALERSNVTCNARLSHRNKHACAWLNHRALRALRNALTNERAQEKSSTHKTSMHMAPMPSSSSMPLCIVSKHINHMLVESLLYLLLPEQQLDINHKLVRVSTVPAFA